MFMITEKAIAQFNIAKESIGEDLPLRVAAVQTQEQGIMYNMGFDSAQDEDHQFSIGTFAVVVDPDSQELCKNMMIDFDEFDGAPQFVFINPDDVEAKKDACGTTPGASSCGTGCSCG